MIRKIANLLNIALFGMACYMYGNYQGTNAQIPVDIQQQINYTVYKAIVEGLQ